MNLTRRSVFGLGAAGAIEAARLNAEAAQRIEGSYVDRKKGSHPFHREARGRLPHIFLITVDMISPDHYRPERAPAAVMALPNMRGLLADSVVFRNAFCVSPLCAPARAALLTGRYPYILSNNERALDGHEFSLRASDVIFPEYLKAVGYVTKHAGKGHLGPQKFFDGFDENADGWDRWDPPIRTDENYRDYLRSLGVKPQRYSKTIRCLQQDRKSPSHNLGGWVEQEDGKPFPMEAQYSYYLADRAVRKLDAALAQGEGGKPVYLQLDFFDPHQPFAIPAELEAQERELRKALRLPASYGHTRKLDFRGAPDEPRIYELYKKYWGLYDQRTAEDYWVANALQVEVVDRALGLFLKALRERGIYDDALVVFTADHGEMNCRRALVDKGVYLYPEVLRVPLAVKMPRTTEATPRQVDAPVSHLDIAPTLLNVAGVEPAERQDGAPLLPLLRGQNREERPYLFECGWHVGVNFACGTQGRCSDGKRYLYSYNCASLVDELYDLAADDPVNVAQQPGFARQREEMIARLGAMLENDPRWVAYWSSYRLDHYFTLQKRT